MSGVRNVVLGSPESVRGCPTITLLHSENPTVRCKSGASHGWVAQLAEQWTENPRVGGSIPPPATPLFIGLFGSKSGRELLDRGGEDTGLTSG